MRFLLSIGFGLFLLLGTASSYAQDILADIPPLSNKLAQSEFSEAEFKGQGFQEPAFQEQVFLPVTEAYQLNTEFEPDGRLRLNWQIADAYYLYRHGFKVVLKNADGDTLETALEIPAGKEKNDEYFGLVQVYYHSADIYLDQIPKAGELNLAVTSQGCADAGLCYPPHTEHFLLDSENATITAIEATSAKTTTVKSEQEALASAIGPASNSSVDFQQLPYMLLLAILGGVILNLMPCVFPVLSLKVLAFANDQQRSHTAHGWIYSAGVIASFILVAAILVSLQAAGEAIGWGFHLQTPWLVALLAYLFFVMGLSLSGYIELGSQWMNAGSSLANRSGYSGSFFTGVLATVVASPCTAPFMGTALGFAVTQPKLVAISVFAALGFGMALPMLILCYSPKLLHKIPKPGPWMDTLKQLLAFPLYATAVWLSWVVGNQTGVNGMATLLLGGVLIALALWLWRGKTVSRLISGCSLAVALGMLSSPLLAPTPKAALEPGDWISYSPKTLAALRQEGKPVFVNITADWCITCLANEKVTLSTNTVKQALKASGITYIKADWTNRDPEITALLKEYGRNGIPLYIVYPTGPAQRGTVLPQILTESIVLDAFDQAVSSTQLSSR